MKDLEGLSEVAKAEAINSRRIVLRDARRRTCRAGKGEEKQRLAQKNQAWKKDLEGLSEVAKVEAIKSHSIRLKEARRRTCRVAKEEEKQRLAKKSQEWMKDLEGLSEVAKAEAIKSRRIRLNAARNTQRAAKLVRRIRASTSSELPASELPQHQSFHRASTAPEPLQHQSFYSLYGKLVSQDRLA
jgi:hypothetical protein